MRAVEPPDDVPARSQATSTYRTLRADILSGRLPPGERLKVADIASRLEVSPGAVREALSRLVPEQLVVSRDQRGFLAAPVSLEDLADLTDLRCEIESVALRRSVERGGLDWEAGIIASAHRLAGTQRLTDDETPTLNPEWSKNHSAFHSALVAACGSRRLMDLHQQLYDQSERYRGLSVMREGVRPVAGEHDGILKAALAHDAEALVAKMVEHISMTTKLIIDVR